jgi:hypothetical protein
MRTAILLVALAGCSDRNLGQSSGGADSGAADLAGIDLAGADLARGPDLARPGDLAGLDLSQNACEAANGYCAPGDFVKPMCKDGWLENTTISNTGVCGLGICCVPKDCRASGCPTGSYCAGCLTPTGEEWVCLGNGSAC